MVKDASIENTVTFLFGNLTGTNYTHSLMSLARNQTTKFVAGASAVTTSVVANLPVNKFSNIFFYNLFLWIFSETFKKYTKGVLEEASNSNTGCYCGNYCCHVKKPDGINWNWFLLRVNYIHKIMNKLLWKNCLSIFRLYNPMLKKILKKLSHILKKY